MREHDMTALTIAELEAARLELAASLAPPGSPDSNASVRIRLSSWEPPIGIEPMTYALRGASSPASHALAAPIAREIALIAHAALGLSGDAVHEPVHVRDPCIQ